MLLFIIPSIYLRNHSSYNVNFYHTSKIISLNETNAVVKEENQKYYLTFEENNSYQLAPNDTISYTCNYQEINSNDSFSLYLNSKNVFYSFYATNITIIEENNNFKTELFLNAQNSELYIGLFIQICIYKFHSLKTNLIFDQLKQLGIIHLFVISGFHIGFFFFMFDYFCLKIIRKKYFSFF